MTLQFRFAAATEGEETVFGAERPGYNSRSVDPDEVSQWVAFMKERGIRRVCSLLPPTQLAYYTEGLIQVYQHQFGDKHVCSVPVEDYRLCPERALVEVILPFLNESVLLRARVVVHCSGGSGRTGHVLAAWLVYRYDMSTEEAIARASATRNPLEAVQCGNATIEELKALLDAARRQRA